MEVKHGSPQIVVTLQIEPFSTSMIMEERVCHYLQGFDRWLAGPLPSVCLWPVHAHALYILYILVECLYSVCQPTLVFFCSTVGFLYA